MGRVIKLLVAVTINRVSPARRCFSTRAREACHEPRPDRIGTQGHHDRDRSRLSPDRRGRRIGRRHNHVRFQAHELPGKLGKSLRSAVPVASLEDEGFAFHMTKLPKTLFERLDKVTGAGRTAGSEQPDPRDLRRWLRLEGERQTENYKGKDEDAMAAKQTARRRL